MLSHRIKGVTLNDIRKGLTYRINCEILIYTEQMTVHTFPDPLRLTASGGQPFNVIAMEAKQWIKRW